MTKGVKNKLNCAANNTAALSGPSEKNLRKQAEMARTPTRTHTKQIAKELGLSGTKLRLQVIMGNIKETEAILRKAISQYGGDLNRVDDICRLMIEVDDAKQLQKAEQMFCTPHKSQFEKNTAKKGKYAHVKTPKNYVSEPKRWGWIGIQLKMKAKLSNGQWAKFEVQIVPKCMKEAYKKTHKLYEQIRTSLEKWEDSRKDIHEVLTPEEIAIAQEILDTHEQAAKDGKIDHVYDRFPKLDDPWPYEAEEDVADVSAEYIELSPEISPDQWWDPNDPDAAYYEELIAAQR